MKSKFSILILSSILLAACSQKKLNERDIKRNQEVATAEAQRTEYQAVAGVYDGKLLGSDDYQQEIVLRLAVQDVPVDEEGQADPVLTPKLTGTLRFLIGSEDSGEYTDAAIESAEYIATRKQLNLVLNHAQFNKMVMNLTLNTTVLSGNWGASTVGASGTVEITKRP